jgi:hypothetical protein
MEKHGVEKDIGHALKECADGFRESKKGKKCSFMFLDQTPSFLIELVMFG